MNMPGRAPRTHPVVVGGIRMPAELVTGAMAPRDARPLG
jgi:hypothetical protein